MSSALTIAVVTAVVKTLLDNSLIKNGIAGSLGDVSVSALPPDRVTVGADERSQLNLFLYRVTPNSAWRARGAEASSPERRPLALDLRYLMTAYGEQDLHAEILLGYGMQTLHGATLTPDVISGALDAICQNGNGTVLPPALALLAGSDMAGQLEHMEVSSEFLSSEEMSRLWSTLQARYRPSAAYKVSTVLIGAAT